MRLCSVAGCGRPHSAFGWCAMHCARWRRHGDPLVVFVIRGDLKACIEAKIDRTSTAPCWQWTGKPNSRTHCQEGHEFTEANTYRYLGPNGSWYRDCRECHNRRSRDRRRNARRAKATRR